MESDDNITTIEEKIRAAFLAEGVRQTHQRDLIASRLAELSDSGEDFSVERLWRDLQQGDPHMGRATVFRSVEMLVRAGLLNRIEFADGSHTYRACGDQHHHHHLTCKICHRVVDVDVCLPEEQLIEIGQENDFEIEGHSLMFYGICADCRVKQKNE